MLVISHKQKQKQKQKCIASYKNGSGFVDTIAKVADVMGNVAKTTSAAKQIYDVIKTRKDTDKPLNKTINKVLSDKSNDIIARLSKI